MTNNDLIAPIILSGGSGTRLWPVSTEKRPKQFLNLTGPLSMFQMTLERCQQPDLFASPIIVGGAKHASLVAEQLDEIGATAALQILEPCARNTAPAIALAALACGNPQTPMLVMPSDHVIKNVPAFLTAVSESLPLAKARWLVTFGIEPNGPETGYGYIQQGEAIVGSAGSFAAQRFVEKPNRQNAEIMLDDGGYHWNAGIFLFRADTYLQALGEHAPEMLEAARNAMDRAHSDENQIRPDEASFARAPSDSIDYAVMEKADKVALTPVEPGWSDVGSWDSLFDISASDDQTNVTSGDVLALDTQNSLIHADKLEIATYGISDLIIIAEGNKVMILPRGQSQNVKKIIMQRDKSD
ncbi:mannose-1-phosphate guanylyltransferase/mannose-6-phosphate isomerase [Sphingorhabdus sp. Alg231-15]|uniref:mannose-1-phosphate guanylyltransferase/mannose-6-phosphate isomerase n=1 Tax=Sphingorhabdus sp. Alg231-15 TaxID=1922222 RepID=UPI000D54F0C7